MGLTFNLGRVSPSVFTDSSLNIGIGAAPSGTYKLEVTGTAKVSSTLLVSGAATFSSSVNIGTAGSEKLNIFGAGSQFINVKNTTSGADMFVGMSSALAAAFIGTGGTDPIVFSTAGTEKMRITSAGNVGIGTSSPDNLLVVSGGTGSMKLEATTTNRSALQIFNTANTLYIGVDNASASYFGYTANSANIQTLNYPIIFSNGSGAPLERMRITSGGMALIGLTSNPASARLAIDAIGMAVYDGGNYRQQYMNGNTMAWWNGANQATLTSAGVWTDASDISIKKDIEDIKYGLDAILKLKPRSYKMKEDDLQQIGFIAQEVEEVIKELVTTDNKGMKGLSYGQITAVLTKAIQEMNTKLDEQNQTIQNLQEQINILQNK